ARAETLTALTSFKLLVDRRRCIIPADGFYEWRKEGSRKVPMWVHLKNREPFGLAGLWDLWCKPDGKRVESFTIITTEPNELMRPVHNRMPVILRSEDEEQWAGRLSNHFRQSAVTAETLSGRVDGRSRRFANRQLSQVQWARVYPTCCRRRHSTRRTV